MVQLSGVTEAIFENVGSEDPGTDEPGTDDPGTDEPGTDEPGTDKPGTDVPGTDQPGAGDNGNGNQPSGNTSSTDKNGGTSSDNAQSVQTGDDTNCIPYATAAFAAGMAALATIVYRRKRVR